MWALYSIFTHILSFVNPAVIPLSTKYQPNFYFHDFLINLKINKMNMKYTLKNVFFDLIISEIIYMSL